MELEQLSARLGEALQSRDLMLTTAESCTGGGVAQAVTEVAGSSGWFERGFVTYSNQAKQEMLEVALQTLIDYGAVSEETVIEMAKGALHNSHAQVSLAVSGIAGPGGGSEEKPVGLVCFAWAEVEGEPVSLSRRFDGDRASVRSQAVACALQGVLDLIDE